MRPTTSLKQGFIRAHAQAQGDSTWDSVPRMAPCGSEGVVTAVCGSWSGSPGGYCTQLRTSAHILYIFCSQHQGLHLMWPCAPVHWVHLLLAHKRWQRCSQLLLHGGCRKVPQSSLSFFFFLVTSRSGYLQKQLVPKKSIEKWNDALWGVLGPSYSGSLPEVQRMPVVISGAAREEGTELMVMSLVDFFPHQTSF